MGHHVPQAVASENDESNSEKSEKGPHKLPRNGELVIRAEVKLFQGRLSRDEVLRSLGLLVATYANTERVTRQHANATHGSETSCRQ